MGKEVKTMIRNGLLSLALLGAVFFLGGCHTYSYMSLRGSVSYGELAAIPYSQSYYDYYHPGYHAYAPPCSRCQYRYSPYYLYDYYYPYPYFFQGYTIFHLHGVKVSPAPGRRFRSSSASDSSPPPSDQPSKGKRRFKR